MELYRVDCEIVIEAETESEACTIAQDRIDVISLPEYARVLRARRVGE